MSRIYVSKKLHMKTEDTPDIPTPTSFVSTADPLSISSHGNEIITPDNLNNHNFETAIVKEEPCDESQDGFSLSNKIDYASPKLPKKKKVSPKNPVDPKRKFPCPIFGCTKSYGKSSHLRSHLTWHTGIKPFVCEIEECGKSFTRSDELARHMRTHTGEKPFECLQCFKKFSRSDHLTKHIATHNRQMSGECECKRKKTVKPGGTSVQTPAKAKRTIPIVVKNEFEEMPSLDGTLKEEEQQQSVKEIADTHLIKEEEADDINSENESNEIKKNIKEELILPDEHNHLGTTPACNGNDTEMLASKLGKPFQCHFHCCSKAFSRSDDLNRHIRTHTGEKPYACEECNKRFIRSDHLKKHIKTHCKKIFRARLRNN